MKHTVIRPSDQSIIDRQDILMQILLVAGLNIILFTSKHIVTIITSVHNPSADERLLSPTLVPPINLCESALSLSSQLFPGDTAQGIHNKRFREP